MSDAVKRVSAGLQVDPAFASGHASGNQLGRPRFARGKLIRSGQTGRLLPERRSTSEHLATAGELRPISYADTPTRVAHRVPARLSHPLGLYEHRGDGA